MSRTTRKYDRTRRYYHKDVQDFILMDSHGRPVRLQSFLERGPAVISFYRGGWCHYCNVELCEFQLALPKVESLGASLLAISPELPYNALATEQKNKLTFPVLSDIRNVVAKRFGIVFKLPAELLALYEESHRGLEQTSGAESTKEFPIPSTFVIDQARAIRMVCVEEDSSRHVAPTMVVRALRRLNKRC